MCKSKDDVDFIVIAESPKYLKIIWRRAKYSKLLSIYNRFNPIPIDLFDITTFINIFLLKSAFFTSNYRSTL